MAIKRRPFLLDAGERLILTDSKDGQFIRRTAERLAEFVDRTGIDAKDVVSDPFITTPVPVYRKGQRFRGLNPDLMWLPLFWLPESVALRYQVRDGGPEPRPETDVEWLTRIALEVQASGLYDADEGGWVDVLALYDLDIDNPVDHARVEAWLDGAEDETLDSIDLSGMLAGREEWAFEQANEVLAAQLPAQFFLTAAGLLAFLDDNPDLLGVVASLAAEMLLDVPGEAPDVLYAAGVAIQAGEPEVAFENDVRAALSEVIDEYLPAAIAAGLDIEQAVEA